MHEDIRLNYMKLMMFECFNKTNISHVQTTQARGGIGLKFLELNIISEDPCAAVFFFTLNWFAILLLTQPMEIEC